LIVRTIDICVFGFFESHLTSPTTLHPRGIRAGSDYGQTLRGEAFGPMKMQKCPKSVLSAFTLKAKVQRTSPPKEPRWQYI
jgi:hypothetical protein